MPEAIKEKLVPQNLEAETYILGCLLIDKNTIIRVADLINPEDFYKDAHAVIFAVIQELYSKHEPIDILSLTSKLEEKGKLEMVGGRSYIANLASSVGTASNVEYHAKIIQKKATLRRLISSASEISELGYEEGEEIDEILDTAEQKLFAVSKKYLQQGFLPIDTLLSNAFERIDELHKQSGKLRGLSTGWPDLDNLLAGLQKSDLIILAARPSVGKTSLALDLARQAAVINKVPVGIFSLEMSKEQLVDRMLCAQANVSLWKMRTGKLSDSESDDDFSKIGQAMGELSEAPIYIDDSAATNIMEIRTKARRLQMEKGLGLIVIDYMQLMEGRGKYKDNRVQEVSEISRGLKIIARELDIPIIVLSQLNRAVEQTKPAIPKLAHLRESGCLAGDTMIMLADSGKLVPIKNLVGKKNIKIFSLDSDYKLVVKNINKVFSSGRKRLYEIKTQSGRRIKASANHPFLTINGWERLGKLSIRQHLAMPRSLATGQPKNHLNQNELILLAHLLGDGCVLPRQPIHYTSADQANLKIVEQTAKKLFTIQPRLVQQKNWYHLYLPAPYHLTHGKKHPITLWFDRLGIAPVRSYEKVIPEAVLSCDQKNIALFLRHLWATDGNISWKKMPSRQTGASIYYSSSSAKLATQVQHLLLTLGIQSTVHTVKQKKYRPMYQVAIQSAPEQLKFCRLIGSYGQRGAIVKELIKQLKKISTNPNQDIIPQTIWQQMIKPIQQASKISWRQLAKKLRISYGGSTLFKSGLSRTRLALIAKMFNNLDLAKLATSDIYWDKIVAITPLKTEEVFDAEVPITHNFVANDFIVHNSIEQDADVVMFIYRRAADRNYDAESLTEEEKRVAELYIAKHRNGPTGKINLYFDENTVSFKSYDTTGLQPPPEF
ncbi:MAG: replicative DNA helicase [bacterium]